MLNQIVPKETSRDHSLLLSTRGINLFLPLAIVFPCIWWDRRTQIFLEEGLCTMAPLPAPLAEHEGYFGYGNSDTSGKPPQKSFGKGQKKSKKGKEKKNYKIKEERRKKEKTARSKFMWKFLHSIPDWDF